MISERVVVIGAGQAGLAVSHELSALGVEHVVLERARVGEAWRGRWDSFRLVSPNWTMMLPGMAYQGDDPEGFVPRDDVVRYLEDYAAFCEAPVRSGVDVSSVEPGPIDGFLLRTSMGEMRAKAVVVCSGAYRRPHRPLPAPPGMYAIDAEDYRRPGDLPDGKVLVVGSGQSGCQIAEELCEDGRDVVLACGRAMWLPRRVDGRDIVTWLDESGFYNASASSPAVRLLANPLLTGKAGGRDLHYRTLQRTGVQLVGHLADFEGHEALFADDLAESVAWGDARHADIAKLLGAMGVRLPEPTPFHAAPPTRVDLRGFGAIVYTSGYRPSYAEWIQFPAFDSMGFPLTTDGVSEVVRGLYFCGVHYMRNRKSAGLFGVGEDAGLVAKALVIDG